MPAISSPVARRIGSTTLIVAGVAAWLASFLLAVQAYASLEATGSGGLLFGIPAAAFGVSLFALPIVFGAAMPASQRSRPKSSTIRMASALLLFGIIGWIAAFALSADKVLTQLEEDPDLSCNFSVLVQCGANLESWQGSVFGFPNPLIGLAGWSAVIAVGVLQLTGAPLARWFWVAFNVGVAGALAFVLWLIAQSIFVLGTLCPWCMATWAVTIPLFWTVTLHNARSGTFGGWALKSLGPAFSWVPLITVASYIAVAVIAQLRLDVLSYQLL